jgi:hemolysin D
VRAGQHLIELDPSQTDAERDRLARDLRQARLEVAGLAALRGDITSGAGLAGFVPPAGVPQAEAGVEQLTIEARRQEQAAKIESFVQQIAAKQAESAENVSAIDRLRASMPFLRQKRDMYRQLMREGLTEVPAWADAEQAASDQQQQVFVLSKHAADVAAGQASLVRDLAQTRAGYVHDVMRDFADADQKVGELTLQLEAASRHAEESVLTSPIDGIVQQLATHTIGGVVTPAQALLIVVPEDGPVLIEATIENKDVGFVHSGQDVEVKVQTFTFTRYGLMHGRVIDISPDAAVSDPRVSKSNSRQKDTGEADDDDYSDSSANAGGYVAHIQLASQRIMVDGQQQRLRPGMSVAAEIKTGRRSIINYLLSPLSRYRRESLNER